MIELEREQLLENFQQKGVDGRITEEKLNNFIEKGIEDGTYDTLKINGDTIAVGIKNYKSNIYSIIAGSRMIKLNDNVIECN